MTQKLEIFALPVGATLPEERLMPDDAINIDLEFLRKEHLFDCEQLFPQWMTARIILSEWVRGITGWEVAFDPYIGEASIVPRATLSPETFPPEDRESFVNAVAPVLERYFPREALADFLGQSMKHPMNSMGAAQIVLAMQRRENEIVSTGGDSFKDALAKALGVWPLRASQSRLLTKEPA